MRGLRGESASARKLLNAVVEMDELQNKSVHKETLRKSVLQSNGGWQRVLLFGERIRRARNSYLMLHASSH